MGKGVLHKIVKRLGKRLNDGDELTPAPQPKPLMKDVYEDENERTVIEGRLARTQEEAEAERILQMAEQATLSGVDEEIRAQIAKKITMLVPTLADSSKTQLLDYTLRVLLLLGSDQAARVRRIVAEELKAMPNAPEELIHKLVHDPDPDVMMPVLEFSPLLRDDELLDILAHSKIAGVTEAIARRKDVSEAVADAIVETHDANAIGSLLANQGAHLSEKTMENIVAQAPAFEMWHESLLLRPELNVRTLNHIAGFVSLTLFEKLQRELAVNGDVTRNLSKAINERLRSVQLDRERSAEIKANDMQKKGTLTAEAVSDALDVGEYEFFMVGLSLLSGLSKDLIKRILNAQNAKAVTAMAWKAGLPMRTAIQMQLRLSRILPADMLNAKDGVDYPLSPEVMKTYLEHFTG